MMQNKGFVRTILIENPSLTDNTADAQRLEKSLQKTKMLLAESKDISEYVI